MNKDLILIDAYSQIFRCYYAVRELTNSKGEPTNAVFAFTRLLLKLYHDFPESHGAMVFDCGRVKFRLALIPEYKANRPSMPEELRKQIPIIRDLAAAFGWPLLEEPEFEADDLIAALAVASREPVKIISSDKDLAQLVNPNVAMLTPDAKNHNWDLRDEARILEKFAVRADQMIDYLALLGDASDNISGVPGIGPKTAAALLKEFVSIEQMLAHPERIASERRRQLIVDHAELLTRNRKLIELRTDLPAHFTDIDAVCRRRAPDWKRIAAICEELELRSIRRELPYLDDEAPPEAGLPLFAEADAAPATPPAAPVPHAPQMVQDDLFGGL
jgi:DNA polymerase-1